MRLSDFHSFFIYVFFGYFFIFPAILICLKVFNIRSPLQRMQLYLLGLATPFAGYALYHTILTKRCQAGVYPAGPGWMLFNSFCRLGTAAVRYLGPALIVLLIAGILKAVASALLVNRMRIRAVPMDEQQRNRVMRILNIRSSALNIGVPEVIFSGRDGFAAFAAGVFKPVIILSTNLLPQLSERELDDILTHELVHICRGDTLRGWLLYFLRDAMFFSPFSRILLNRYLQENERLCDRETVNLTGNSRAYAATLVKVWRLLLHDREMRLGLAFGFTGGKNDLEQRVTSLLGDFRNEKMLPAVLFATLLLAVFSGTVLYLGFIC
ncbi:MAG: M56 family metallopeptidase [Clostridiales bacterium]|jgi:beta-lactamase regulating signal transducer with metallopeptidase domain|nr:M56 family metallopeptidase [Clostridiales bacterium]